MFLLNNETQNPSQMCIFPKQLYLNIGQKIYLIDNRIWQTLVDLEELKFENLSCV